MRRLAAAALLAATTMAGVAHAQVGNAGLPDTTFEAALLDVVLVPVRSGTVSALRTGDRALLPVAQVLAILEVAGAVGVDSVLSFTRPSDGAHVRVDRRDRSVLLGRARRVLGPALLVGRGDQTLLDAAELAGLLGVTMTIDYATLRVTVTNGDSLPPLQRLRRANRWARLLDETSTHALPPDEYRGLNRPIADGAMLDYTLAIPTPTLSLRRDASFSTALGANLLGGSLEAFVSGTLDGRQRDVTGSWLGVWRTNPWVTQLKIGDGLTTGPRPRLVRGVAVGNTPFLRPLEFGTLPVNVRGDSSWEVESYVNGRLVRVDTLRGRDASVPMLARYGSNVIDRVAYGPLGEIRRSEQLLSLTAAELLPRGTWEYGLSGGECGSTACTHTANADGRVGITSRWSLRAGVEAERDSLSRWTVAPYAGSTVLGPRGVTVSGSLLSRGEASGVLRWQPTLDRGAVIEHMHRMASVPFAEVIRGAALDRTDASAFARIPWWNGATHLSLAWRDERSPQGDGNTRARVGLGVRIPFGQLFPYVEDERLRGGGTELRTRTVGFAAYSLPARRVGPLFNGTWFATTAEWREGQPSYVSASAARPLGSHLRFDIGMTARGLTQPTFSMRLFGDLGVARLVSTTVVDANGTTSGSHQMVGSMFVDPRRGTAMLTRGPLLQRAGVSGRVYLDMNANGRFDADELALKGVTIRVGTGTVVTDAQGRFLATDILPFEPVSVELEAASLESPLWVAAVTRITLEPAPNTARRVDIPVLAGGVVEGQLLVSGGDSLSGSELAGVDVRLEAIGPGGRTKTIATFSDGVFSFLGVAPGRYHLHIDSPVWTGPDSAPFDVRAVANGDRVRGLVLRATRRVP